MPVATVASWWWEDVLRATTTIASEPTETLLAEFSSSGHQPFFEEIVRRYAGMVFSVCLRTCKDAHDAEDATQAVFLALAVQCKSGNPVRHLPAWLRQVAKRTSLDVRKSRKRREAREAKRRSENSGIVNDDDKPSSLDIGEVGQVLSEELAKLPAKYRLPLVSLYFGGLSREEIAEQLGLKPGALGVRLHRARTMLGERLKRRGAVSEGLVLSVGMAPLLENAFGGALAIRTVEAAARVMLGHDLSGAVSANVLSLMHGTYGAVSLGKLKLIASVLLLLTTVGGGGGVAVARSTDSVPQLLSHVRDWLDRVRFEFHLPRLELRAAADAATPAVPLLAHVPEPIDPQLSPTVGLPGEVATAPLLTPQAAPVASTAAITRPPQSNVPPPMRFPTVIANAPALQPGGGVTAARPVETASASDVDRGAEPADRSARRPAAPVGGPATEVSAGAVSPQHVTASGTGAVTLSNKSSAGSRYLASAAGRRTRGHVAGPTLSVGAEAGTSGTYTLDAGTLVTGTQDIGRSGEGTFVQNGGTNVTTQLLLGENAGGIGGYRLRRGTLRLSRGGNPAATGGLVVGGAGEGSLEIGDEVTAGHIVGDLATGGFPTRPLTDVDGAAGPYVVVRADAAGAGVVRGWGRFDAVGGTFINNGQVIADGYGRDRELALADFGTIGNTIENPRVGGTNGWFAKDGGALTMPALASGAMPGRFTWGEGDADDQLDLVNSVRAVIEPPPEVVTISLVSQDRTDVPLLPDGHNFIGVWSMDTNGAPTDRIDLSVRYDDGLAAEQGLSEASLKLWRFAGGEWTLLNGPGFWRDVDAHLIGGQTDALEYFAVSAPEPGSVVALAAVGAAALLRRRRRE